MDLLQYTFTLDPGFSMAAIRERVAAKRHLLEGLPGLRWKAWLLSETLPGRTQAKTYAPLYLFEGSPAVQAFLCGDLYKSVTDSFGWTRPHHGRAMGGPSTSIAGARSCALTVSSLDDHAALRRALAASGGLAPSPQPCPAMGTALATLKQLDIARMQLRDYTFCSCEAAALSEVHADLIYEVVAVSGGLPRGDGE